MNDVYICTEDLEIQYTLYKVTFGYGTVRQGTRFELEKEPTPKKKLYKLIEIVQNERIEPRTLYVRKSTFLRYFTKQEMTE